METRKDQATLTQQVFLFFLQMPSAHLLLLKSELHGRQELMVFKHGLSLLQLILLPWYAMECEDYNF
jgi:hypothetical protein